MVRFQNSRRSGDLPLACQDLKNIENVQSFIIQYIVPKQLVEKSLFSVPF